MSAVPEVWRDLAWRAGTASNYPTLRSTLFVDAEGFLRLALGAYYAAVKDQRPPDGEKWLEADPLDAGLPYATAETFNEMLAYHLGERLRVAAVESGHLIEQSGCRGGATAIKGHGCPALASAVGPAPTGSPAVDITIPAEPLFCGQSLQELPGRSDPAIVTQQRGKASC